MRSVVRVHSGFLLVIALAATGLTACKKIADATSDGAGARGRYVGVGIYHPGEPWTKMVVPAQVNDGAARVADDQAIIVVVDSETGELRACGDLSGYCIGMDPWKKMLATSQMAPVSLTGHAKPPADAEANTADPNAAASQ